MIAYRLWKVRILWSSCVSGSAYKASNHRYGVEDTNPQQAVIFFADARKTKLLFFLRGISESLKRVAVSECQIAAWNCSFGLGFMIPL